jgi:surface polysaccharide O-acyltransferase-like enzyme
MPFIQLTTHYTMNNNVFLLGGWVGYFVLGAYLHKAQVSTKLLLALLTAGFAATIAGAWFMNFPLHSEGQYYFFFNSLTVNVIVASVALFLILRKVPTDWPAKKHLWAGKLIHAISKNTLPIFLLHVIILESLQRGYFGFQLSLTTMNPLVEVPLITAVTLFISLGLVLVLKKVPVLKRLIG